MRLLFKKTVLSFTSILRMPTGTAMYSPAACKIKRYWCGCSAFHKTGAAIAKSMRERMFGFAACFASTLPSGAYKTASISIAFVHSIPALSVQCVQSSFNSVLTKISFMCACGRRIIYTSRNIPLMRNLSWSSKYEREDHLNTNTSSVFFPCFTRGVTSNSDVLCDTLLYPTKRLFTHT